MTRTRWIQLAVVTAVSVWLAWRAHANPDYFIDGGPPIDALINGRLHELLQSRPLMGPLSLLLRAPFAALSHLTGHGGPEYGYEDAYRFGVFPCVFVAGLLGMWVSDLVRRAGRGPLVQWTLLLLCMINPVSSRAIALGHPEEILGGALLVAGMLLALADRIILMTLALAAALLTKQWSLFALLPAAVVLGWQRVKRPLLIGGAIVLVLVIPVLATDPASLWHVNWGQLNIRNEHVQPASVWYPFTHSVDVPGRVGYHNLPHVLQVWVRPLIVLIGLGLPLLYARRIRQDPVGRALPLVALILLLRCMLDPVNNGYYHVPFFLALIAADALAGRIAATLVAAAALEAITLIAQHGGGPVSLSAVYLVWAVPFAAYLAARTYGAAWLETAPSRTRLSASGRAADFSAE